MRKESIALIKLEASEGMVLTNGESCGKTVYLGDGDSPENWHEITEAEAAAIQEAQASPEDGRADEPSKMLEV